MAEIELDPFIEELSPDEVLDDILPGISKWSEDIEEFEEKEYYKNRWLQVNPDQKQKEVILHLFFLDDYEYLSSRDGDIIFNGKWQALTDSNSFIFHKTVNKQIAHSELYDIAFLNEDFFILKKHGNQEGKNKYLMLANEESVQGMDWEEMLNLLEGNQSNIRTTLAIVLIVGLAIALLAYKFF